MGRRQPLLRIVKWPSVRTRDRRTITKPAGPVVDDTPPSKGMRDIEHVLPIKVARRRPGKCHYYNYGQRAALRLPFGCASCYFLRTLGHLPLFVKGCHRRLSIKGVRLLHVKTLYRHNRKPLLAEEVPTTGKSVYLRPITTRDHSLYSGPQCDNRTPLQGMGGVARSDCIWAHITGNGHGAY
jgi:hypothetical protein